ncbi:MAG: hypothetical protein IJR46_03785 [Neisseriaceae bacterium]|nr:hypothetical protein [Neisseriaceae bacterium]
MKTAFKSPRSKIKHIAPYEDYLVALREDGSLWKVNIGNTNNPLFEPIAIFNSKNKSYGVVKQCNPPLGTIKVTI